jgi:rare lipoprotein A
MAAIPDAVPRAERLHRYANRPYQVFGKDYVPAAAPAPFRQTGVGSWYGRRFHGLPTSSGEAYDMYAMTAAHPTLPIPSYARVTNLANGRSVVVRINDRGPFHSDRVIDLSYTAAWKLGYVQAGSARVEVQALLPDGAPPLQQASKPEPTAPQFPTRATITEPTGFYLQLGAFSSRQAAETFRVRVHRELAWLSDAIRVIGVVSVFRLHVGPYRSQDEARSIADRIQAELKLRPMLVTR